jgi:uncharacterized protein
MPASEPPSPPRVVLDTNVVLDWLLFLNPAVNPLVEAIQNGAVRWITCPRMQQELAATLTKPSLRRWNPRSERLLTSAASHAILRPEPKLPAAVALPCTDPDDQVFIDLALTEGARWLVSRDRALLKLARRAAHRGLGIVTPERWPGA